ncbi:MAG: hypothetical protein H0U70_05310 [Tatlockia sp.]|nr:hypothetical protein [Tatlockia sp.]
MRKYSVLVIAGIIWFNLSNQSFAQALLAEEEISSLVRFLISDNILVSNSSGKLIPLSFYIGNEENAAAYFGDFICNRANSCTITNNLAQNSSNILGSNLPPNEIIESEILALKAQRERINIKYGSDVYHSATWQIALALAAENGFLDKSQARVLVANQLETIIDPVNRAYGKAYRYGGETPIIDPRLAFSFRWLPTSVLNPDPFFKGRYHDYIVPLNLNTSVDSYLITWSDYLPLTGKNAWAQLIGPLQANYLLNSGKIDLNSPALVNAINSLTAFSLMQAGIGAFYHAPAGTVISSDVIILEDNFAVLAGLQILKNCLNNTLQTPEIREALAKINVMLNGGLTLKGFKTKGLLSFLYNGAFDWEHKIFYTSGSAPTPSSTDDWRPHHSNFTSATKITTNLWALSALGVETIDNWFGAGSALTLWQVIRQKGGYFEHDQLSGFGYSLNNNSSMNAELIMTTEGTASAISALNSLVNFYGDTIQNYKLQANLDSLQQNILHLRNDLYLESNFIEATDRSFYINLPTDQEHAFLQSSRRFARSSDWSSNTLPSTSASAWILMAHFNFNPFQYKGKLEGENYLRPETVNFLATDVLQVDAIAKPMIVHFRSSNLSSDDELAIRYNLNGSKIDWQTLVNPKKREGYFLLPEGTKVLDISFAGTNVVNTCHLIPANQLCIESDCREVKTINIQRNTEGLGTCELSF